MERVAMLSLLPGIEYALSFFEKSMGELRQELEAIYGKIRNGHTPPSNSRTPAPAPEEDGRWITAKEGGRLRGISPSAFTAWAKRNGIRSRPGPPTGRGGRTTLLYHAGDVREAMEASPPQKTARPAKAKRRVPRGSTLPLEIGGWLTVRGAAKELGMNADSLRRLHKEKALRSRKVPAPPGSRNNVPRVVFHPDDIAKVKAERAAQ